MAAWWTSPRRLLTSRPRLRCWRRLALCRPGWLQARKGAGRVRCGAGGLGGGRCGRLYGQLYRLSFAARRRACMPSMGYGQLAWQLRQDSRVIVMERTNARYLAALPEPVRLVTIDASFISLRLLLPVVQRWLQADGRGHCADQATVRGGRSSGRQGRRGARQPECISRC